MSARRKVASLAAVGVAPLALTALSVTPAAAHGSMTDPVSRVSACFQEGPESPKSAACKAAVAASGAQAFYDWNGVNIANAAGKSKEIIPDGKLCSAGNDKYKGLDLPRGDWPSSKLSAGNHTFRYKGTAPHKGSFELFVTKESYDPSKPLKWSDLEEKPFVKVTDPKMENGDYVFDGKIPAREGRHLIYSIWQRSDSPEAFYTCSDVVFGKDSGSSGGNAPAPAASAPTDQDIAAGADKSSVEHHGHGDSDAETGAEATGAAPAAPVSDADEAAGDNRPEVNGGAEKPVTTANDNLAETGGDSTTPYIAMGGAAILAVGAAAMFATTRRRAAGRHGR
ncbi:MULTISPECIES: lytic polysaccharide monooxygenase [unclassified Streptomyces]|uniref:lytic polysaccharide monooxygenase auxiliary activity family 9 protein n=1 Tax=unclassified Streptomyces TaxID=2593676 RepID=UPI00136CE754|nr:MULTISPECIES: lytic polysaccharide monooxygenase [unclassified Streptomyces]MYY80397.1 chitin-binding protein [Streptomyces sp. SID335]MYZ16187.1 chitin-binding protein [Streptomyces sp. SID337]NDZ89150.1 lytic polysaccharide monooxygenase [Streptomyces sp. SID10115]NEB47307.1 lytic polysaccharide monooxygenase [Streptomyces sp. SID339]